MNTLMKVEVKTLMFFTIATYTATSVCQLKDCIEVNKNDGGIVYFSVNPFRVEVTPTANENTH